MASNGLRSCDRSKSKHGIAGYSTSCDTEVSRSNALPPLAPPGTRPRRLPRSRAATNGTSISVDEPAALNGREVGYERASGQAGDRSPVQPPVLSGTVPEEPDTCLVQPPTSSLASVHRGMIATADSSERFVPNLLMPCLC